MVYSSFGLELKILKVLGLGKVVHQVLKQITPKGHVRDSQTAEILHPNPAAHRI